MHVGSGTLTRTRLTARAHCGCRLVKVARTPRLVADKKQNKKQTNNEHILRFKKKKKKKKKVAENTDNNDNKFHKFRLTEAVTHRVCNCQTTAASTEIIIIKE